MRFFPGGRSGAVRQRLVHQEESAGANAVFILGSLGLGVVLLFILVWISYTVFPVAK